MGQLDLFESETCKDCLNFQKYENCNYGKCLKRWGRKINSYIYENSNCLEMGRRLRESIKVDAEIKRLKDIDKTSRSGV